MQYKYYKPCLNETNRPKWLMYTDKLINHGRRYIAKPDDEHVFSELNQDEYNMLISYLFEDTTLSDKISIIFGNDSEKLILLVIDYLKSFDSRKLEESEKISCLISMNIFNHYEKIVENIFNDVSIIKNF